MSRIVTLPSYPAKPLAVAILGATLTLQAGLFQPLLSAAGQAHAEESMRRYAIAPGTLGAVLSRFASEAGVVLSFDAALTNGKQSKGLQGTYSVPQGFAQLLAGSALQVTRSTSGDYVLIPRSGGDAVELGATSINGSVLGATTEGTHAYATGATNTATRMNLSIKDTPQSVTVVTRQRIEDQNLKNLDEVLLNTTGITLTRNGSERSNYYARGQQIDTLQIDGVPTNIGNSYSMDALSKPDTNLYDRIEVVRGANGLMQGAGNPSAAVNLVRKRPTAQAQAELSSSLGSWDTWRNALDVSGPLNDSGTLRGRSVLAYTKGNSYLDEAGKENTLVYAIAEADLSDSSLMTLGFSYQKDRNPGYDWSGLPSQANGNFYPLSRSTALTGSWSKLNKANTTVFADYQQQFDNDWKLVVAANLMWAKSDFLANYTWPVAANAGKYTLNPRGFRYDDTQTSLDGYFTGPFSLLGRQHEAVFGFNLRHDDFDYHGGRDASYSYILDVNNLNAFNPPAPNINYSLWKYNYTTQERGAYAATRLNLTDSTHLIIGTRMSWYESESDINGVKTELSRPREIVPYVGIVQDLTETLSAYASYTEIFKPQSTVDFNGSMLDPATGSNYEMGLKAERLDKRLGGSVALFQTDLTGVAQSLASCATGIQSCAEPQEKIRTRGIDLEAYGEPLPGWNLSAGYTYSSPRYDGGSKKGSAAATDIPRHLFKLNTDYRLPAPLQQLRIGASLYAQSSMYKSDATWRVQQGGYAITGFHAVYEVSKDLDVQYNLNNAFDRKYYQTVQYNHYNNFYGEPRNFTVGVRMKF
ncbi:TonB-dependent siderophore receptor [Pseudomonas sp. 3A(2025)]